MYKKKSVWNLNKQQEQKYMDKLKIKNTQAGIKVFQTAKGFLKNSELLGKSLWKCVWS